MTVSPTYFETALKEIYSRDADSARMYDLIKGSMTLDFGYIYTNALNWPDTIFTGSCTSEDSFASNLAKIKVKCETCLEDFLEKMSS